MKHKHKIPANLIPTETICIPLFIPHDPEYIALVTRTLRQLELDRHYERDANKSAKIVREQFRTRTITPFIESLSEGVSCTDQTGIHCFSVTPENKAFEFYPNNPYIDPNNDENAIIVSQMRWDRVSRVGLATIPYVGDALSEFAAGVTGYFPNDVILVPELFDFWQNPIERIGDIITGLTEFWFPYIKVRLEGAAEVDIEFVKVPLGCAVVIIPDLDLSLSALADTLVEFIDNDGDFPELWTLIEIARDIVSIPPELDVIQLEKVTFDEDGEHTIHMVFVPRLNDEIPFLNPFGGIRSIRICDGVFINSDTDEPITAIDYGDPDNIQDGVIMANCDDIKDCFNTDSDYISFQIVIFSGVIDKTEDYLQEIQDTYDDTPQSIAPHVPVTAPDATERNALCYALQSYLELYAATKSAKIQQKNLLQIAWARIREAQNAAFNFLIDVVSPIYTPNFYDCWVSDSEALEALADTAAIEAVASCLLDELDGVAMSESNFNDAIDACAVLTGTAGDIACVLSNDNDLQVYLLFLESYNIALQRQINGEILPSCVCEEPTDYWMIFQNLTYGLGQWELNTGTPQADGILSVSTSGTNTVAVQIMDLGDVYATKAAGVLNERFGSTGNGSADFDRIRAFPEVNLGGTAQDIAYSAFKTCAALDCGTQEELGFGITQPARSIQGVFRDNGNLNYPTNYVKVRKIVVYGLCNEGQVKPPQAVYIDAIPTVGTYFD